MSRRKTIWDSLKWDFLILAILGSMAFVYGLLQQPRLERAESPQTTGSRPPDRTEGDVLLLLPSSPAAVATSFETLDCGYSWYNALWHHFGTFATATLDELSPQLLVGRAAVIVPARVATELNSAGRNSLERFAREGGQLVLELPREGWEQITGISTTGEVRQARQLTAVEGVQFHGPMRDHLLDVPLSGRLLPTLRLEPRPTGPVVFDVEDQPGMLVQPLGAGRVHILLFDFACSLSAMHQGRPTRDLEFGPPSSPRWIPTSARVAHERLLEAHVPYADLLQKVVLTTLNEIRPIPRLWPFPGTYRGALMTIHSAETMPRAALGYADWARANEGSSTIFAAADRFNSHHGAIAKEIGAEIGLVWVIGEDREPMTESVGFGALEPWARELSLPRQKAGLERTLGKSRSLRLARTESALWENDWSSTFRTLAAAGIRVDASFGPSEASQFGYLFGTGLPFYPLDERGLPLPILEAPFVLNSASISVPRLQRMLANSDAAFHQSLIVSLPADAMARQPAAGTLIGLRNLQDLGRRYNHWLTTLGDFTDFSAVRRQSVLTSQWQPQQSRLIVSVNLIGVRLMSASEGALPSVAIPAKFEGREIERVVMDGESLPLSSLPHSGTGDERLVALEPGRHVFSVFYQSPPSEDEL